MAILKDETGYYRHLVTCAECDRMLSGCDCHEHEAMYQQHETRTCDACHMADRIVTRLEKMVERIVKEWR